MNYWAPRSSHRIRDTWLNSNFYEQNLEGLLDYKLSMTQHCVAPVSKKNVVKLLHWDVFTDDKGLGRGIPNFIVFSTGHTTFGSGVRDCNVLILRTTRKGRCLDACHNSNTKMVMFGLDKRVLALDSI